ncbi:MAG: hypothetical protein ACRDNZ_24675 [Streptosporangiaceae bacterium]
MLLIGCSAGALVVLLSVYLALLIRGLRNELIIGEAIEAMRKALDADPPPQRELLAAVADALAAQDRAAARIDMIVRDLICSLDALPRRDELLSELLELPEPQLLVADFLRVHAGGPSAQAMFLSVAADMLRSGTAKAFGDLAAQGLADLDRLMPLADGGLIGAVAQAGHASALDPNPPHHQAPRVDDLDPAGLAAIVRSLDRTARRQLRLATVLHGQAEAMMRLRRSRRRGAAALWLRLRNLASFPLPRKPDFRLDDLNQLAIALDAVGEVLHLAGELAAAGELTRAAHRLAVLRVPVPAGWPGRMYLQESLAQARPLARFGVWHRLAVCRWTTSALAAISRPDAGQPKRAGASARPAEPRANEVDR